MALAAPLVSSGDDGTTAAQKYGWNTIVRQDNFDGDTVSSSWGMYDGPGHAGNGRRSPAAFSVKDGILTVTGTPDGTTGGMAWKQGSLYGRWETRARYTAGTSAYHPVLLLWPDKEDWPVGGEVDYSEVGDGTRQNLDFFLHYGQDNQQEHGSTKVDMTQWHNYAVEWTKDHVVGYVDGTEFFRNKNPAAVPPRSMHATIQLDWFPEDGEKGPGKMEVDWIRQYSI
ncbi:glycosyl hydrolases family 16 domain-containing protein [Pochonia chlamydosporia 170]|uniref:Glycosyl hydrolases family 16 domain-containing protein n=1 Tax=Pochonia chlamydosporia 170 TaxID=1380566 RepID=A0A179G9L7_METCM|nr:glycosyl hydrolases family 16 domain-containing protein [Pochonia chlamydosporia 170]OAQ74083.1 glycosyl hydrolases family 16 domain-containing protein [Pochonia chlamydosporia 170]